MSFTALTLRRASLGRWAGRDESATECHLASAHLNCHPASAPIHRTPSATSGRPRRTSPASATVRATTGHGLVEIGMLCPDLPGIE
jgi:hypothetical protein